MTSPLDHFRQRLAAGTERPWSVENDGYGIDVDLTTQNIVLAVSAVNAAESFLAVAEAAQEVLNNGVLVEDGVLIADIGAATDLQICMANLEKELAR